MISVVLCGGVGARLWPVSRDLFPKPFIRLNDGQSFIQKAFFRGADAPEASGLLVVTNRQLYFKVEDEYKETGLRLDTSFILEPFGRNTGPAIAAAALTVREMHGEDEPLLVLPSDHLISKPDELYKITRRALELAKAGRLVTFGIAPTTPETGFGYIEADGEQVLRFVEKPSLEKAVEYLQSGRFLWNSGMFCFTAGTMLTELRRYAPDLLTAVETCVRTSPRPYRDAARDANVLDLDGETFGRVPSISIDYAVFEKSETVSVVCGVDMEWNDVGSWNELCGLESLDSNGNRVAEPANTVLHDTRNTDISNKGSRLIATLGVENLLIVDTDDALLVADRSRAQDVRVIYDRLKKTGHEAYRQHRTIYRPWGSYTLLEEGSRFKIKRLAIKPGASISLQRHHNRSEHWIVVSGMAEVTCGEQVYFVSTNESTYIKAGSRHRVGNPGRVELVLIEVQSGDYLGEDDIVRFEDNYGRV